ncbi:hypothetical protein E2562_029923 [Oryza meyeriana var. granulata]|uniref:Uncharacterized protein n=1 Tax=Oryza meyeriana var. granulata TaxID=110450 RepID=A0A6G1CUR0_9ORYZ|nr:hypothetical protein E2562_029923 [Oryza meyeriana var. granulata]
MDLLEQPLEAVAFRLYSLPEAAALGAAAWTCLAAVLAAAAAAGIWRLRAAQPVAMGDTSSGRNGLEPETSSKTAAAAMSEQTRSSPEPASSLTAPSPKERYTAYYHDSCCVGCCDLDDEDGEEVVEEEEDGVDEPSETMPFEWEVVMSLPLSLTAACRYRDSPPLGGSVVRLWDQAAAGGLTAVAAASPRRRGRAAGVVSAF